MLRSLLIAILSLGLSFSVLAQDSYPSRSVKFVVPFPPGGPLDVPARLIAQKLTDLWGKPVVVENITGASGSIGAHNVARAAPDGYTLLVTVDIPLTMFPAVAKQLPYEPMGDFLPIGIFARLQNGLFVHPSLPAQNTAELVELAKKNPGKYTYSSAGIASPAHFGGELFEAIAGVDLTHIPYKGAAPAMAAAVSGEVNMMFGPTTQGAPQVRAGKLKAFGVTGPRTSALLPGVKPFVEQGYQGLVFTNWEGVFVPAKTPEAVAEVIGAGWKRVMNDPEVRGKLAGMDLEPVWEGAEETRKALAEDFKRWSELAKRANIQSPN